MHSMLNSVDAAAAAETAQLLEGELAARELLQAVVDRISGAPLLTASACRYLRVVCIRRPPHSHPCLQINILRPGLTRACDWLTATGTRTLRAASSG